MAENGRKSRLTCGNGVSLQRGFSGKVGQGAGRGPVEAKYSVHEDGLISKWNVAAGTLWTAVVGLMAASWMVFLLGDQWKVAGMLAATACATGGAAAVLHVRGYFVRLSRMIRLTRDGEDSRPQLVR